jgi:hypothetical protein
MGAVDQMLGVPSAWGISRWQKWGFHQFISISSAKMVEVSKNA